MLKFFRKIRQRLLSENKFTKYVIYALGEILLIVIGILIALQITNNNEIRKNKEKETAYLQNIRKDLIINFHKINELIEGRNRRIESANKLIGQIEGEPIEDWHEFNEQTIQIYTWQRFYQHNYVLFAWGKLGVPFQILL